jgi:hypothetical protein
MDCKLRKEIEDFIFGFPIKDGTTNQEQIKQLAEEYMAFRVEVLTEKQQESFCFKLIGKSKTVLQWWQADYTDWPLLQNLAASAAASAKFLNFWTHPFKVEEFF